jgi:hypothetical protein
LNSIIVRRDAEAYLAPMASAIFRLLALFAVLLMPFGMAAAPAAAATGHHQASMPANHCGDMPVEKDVGGLADCAMPCSAALPATDLAPAELAPIARTTGEPWIEHRLAGVLMEIATPPPKLS